MAQAVPRLLLGMPRAQARLWECGGCDTALGRGRHDGPRFPPGETRARKAASPEKARPEEARPQPGRASPRQSRQARRSRWRKSFRPHTSSPPARLEGAPHLPCPEGPAHLACPTSNVSSPHTGMGGMSVAHTLTAGARGAHKKRRGTGRTVDTPAVRAPGGRAPPRTPGGRVAPPMPGGPASPRTPGGSAPFCSRHLVRPQRPATAAESTGRASRRFASSRRNSDRMNGSKLMCCQRISPRPSTTNTPCSGCDSKSS